MQKKGTILIVDDRILEKIGSFSDHLVNEGFNIEIAETYEKAEKALKDLINSNTLDGIILDFSFPVNKEDPSVSTDGIPNGVRLLKKYEFKINLKNIPIVINTTGDEDYKKKYLGSFTNLKMPIYNVNHQANLLSQATIQLVQQILNMFNQSCERRQLNSQVEPDKKWIKKGKTGTYDKNTGKYHYNRDGD